MKDPDWTCMLTGFGMIAKVCASDEPEVRSVGTGCWAKDDSPTHKRAENNTGLRICMSECKEISNIRRASRRFIPLHPFCLKPVKILFYLYINPSESIHAAFQSFGGGFPVGFLIHLAELAKDIFLFVT